MEVENDLMGYPYLKIYQDTDGFNFSIDSVLLAHFATIKKSTLNIIDLGTGNAPIPLYLTLRTKSKIIGVEIQEKSFNLAQKSVKINNKEEQITILNANIIDIYKEVGFQKFDLVLCNPPFFKYSESSNINKNDYKTIARHEVLINLDQICKEVSLLLNNGGTFAMVHRPDRITDIITTLRKYGLEPKRMCLVYPRVSNDANHVLIEARKTRQEGGLICLPPIIIHDEDGKYSKQILDVFNKKQEG